jgi:DNA-binding NarL/FixJ family response regulator
MTRILIVDDHPVVQVGLEAVLSRLEDIEIVGLAANGQAAVQKTESVHPDVVIMDISLPGLNGIEATRQIKRKDPTIKVIIHTVHSYKEFLVSLMKAGISAFVSKEKPISELILAVQVVRRGGTFLTEEAFAYWADHRSKFRMGSHPGDSFDLLSPREREVFQFLAEGNSVRKTADLLNISARTVEAHKYRIIEKLQIRSMTEWTKEAVRRGIIHV